MYSKKEFEENTIRKRTTCGNYKIACRMGFWSVESYSEPKALREANHYFSQYWADGEYNGTANEKLFNELKNSK